MAKLLGVQQAALKGFIGKLIEPMTKNGKLTDAQLQEEVDVPLVPESDDLPDTTGSKKVTKSPDI